LSAVKFETAGVGGVVVERMLLGLDAGGALSTRRDPNERLARIQMALPCQLCGKISRRDFV
jgi:hypothetical protein